MTPLTGWIKLHRKVMDSAVWNLSPGQYKVWDTILLLANNTDRRWWNGREEIEIPRGSFVTSQPKLAEKAKVSRKTVMGALTNLKRIGSIRAKTRDKRFTLIEVVNFPSYQGADYSEGQEEGQLRDKQGTSKGHNVRMKERENVRKEPPASPFDEQAFWGKFPPQGQEIIRQTIEALHSTRKRGRVAGSVIEAELRWWDQQDPAQVIAGMRTYLEKGYAAHGKREEYLRGVIRNSDGEPSSPVPQMTQVARAIQRAAMNMTREDVSD